MKKPNLLFFGIDSLRSDFMSLYGYHRLTTPHIDAYLKEDALVFDHCISPSIPTTPGYASMLTGMDCFGTNVVALRHKGDIARVSRRWPRCFGKTATTRPVSDSQATPRRAASTSTSTMKAGALQATASPTRRRT